jgi:N-acetylmuramoyl-L-alanine amidase
MKKHTITEGECVLSVAYEHGHFWETVWNDPRNAALRTRRQNPNLVVPGDEVVIPDLRVKTVTRMTGAQHQFRRRGVPARFTVRFNDAAGAPRAGIPYVLRIDGKERRGVTDPQGTVSCALAPNASAGRLVLGEGGKAEAYELVLRDLGPSDTVRGVQARLCNLGWFEGEVDGNDSPALHAALVAFQASAELAQTGRIDDATCRAISAAHGS